MLDNFSKSPIMLELAKKPYWTINEKESKKPIDIWHLYKTGEIRGAYDETALTTLPNLFKLLGGIPDNFVYSLDAIRDNIVVLDVEKTCPEDLKSKLIQTAFLYGDISVSGKGIHLVFPCPALDEVTESKVAMKEENGNYEILLKHYVTFTKNGFLPIYDNENAPVKFQNIWNDLAEKQKLFTKQVINFDIDDIDMDFPEYDELFNATVKNYLNHFSKKPEDYNNDMSRFEFAVIGKIRLGLIYLLDLPKFSKLNLTENQQIMIVYRAAEEILPHRAKHEQVRNGKPMLLYQTCNSFATRKDNPDNN